MYLIVTGQESFATSVKSLFTKSGVFKLRWFVLDVKKQKLSYYKEDSGNSPESGFIDCRLINDVTLSALPEAPEYALDLVCKDRVYTIACNSHNEMIRWAYAINLSRSKPNLTRAVSRSNSIGAESKKWFRYDVVYEEPGPLMINVMGTATKDRSGHIIKLKLPSLSVLNGFSVIEFDYLKRFDLRYVCITASVTLICLQEIY
jgi:hypothetical protein